MSIDDPPPDLRSGMTASVTIRCAEVPNALQVPVQAVYAHGDKFYCFVYDAGKWEAREIVPGPTNDKFFVIESGLNEGDRVSMNPKAYLAQVDLPKLAPEAAQRAVRQSLDGSAEGGRSGRRDRWTRRPTTRPATARRRRTSGQPRRRRAPSRRPPRLPGEGARG